MPVDTSYLPSSLLDLASQAQGQQSLDDAVSVLRAPGLLDDAISGITDIYHRAQQIFTPMPIEVSPRSTAPVAAGPQLPSMSGGVPVAMPSVPSGPPPTPTTPSVPTFSAADFSQQNGQSVYAPSVTLTSGQRQTGASLQPGESVGSVTMTNGGPPAGMSDEAWARQEATRLGIDPQKAVDVGNTEGGFTQPGRQNVNGAPAYGSYQDYIGGPENPGLGDEMLAHGIDPRDPAQSKQAITYSLEHAARNGWGAFQGAAANGIGQWDGIGQDTTKSDMSRQSSANPPPAAPTQSSTNDVAQSALDDPDKWALCGPVAAVIAATRRGAGWTVAQAKQIASSANLWDANTGMHGLGTEVDLLNRMGVSAQTGAANEQQLAADAQSGNTPIVSTNRHYFILTGYDPQTGTFDTTTTGSVLRGGSQRLTLAQIDALGGGIQGAAYMDNPSSPAPSAVAAPTAGVSSAPAGTVAPAADGSPAAGASDPLRDQLGAAGNAGPSSLKRLPGEKPADLPADVREQDQGPHEWRDQYGRPDYGLDDGGRPFNGAPSVGSWPGDDQNPTLPNYGGQPAPRPYVPDYTDPSQQPRSIGNAPYVSPGRAYGVPDSGPNDSELATTQTMYRQPLSVTMGPDTTAGSAEGQALPDMGSPNIDPRSADQGPHEATPGSVGAQPLYTPDGGGGRSVAGSSPAGGAPVAQLAEQPEAAIGPPQPYSPYGDQPDATHQTTPGASPSAPSGFPGLQAVYDSAGNFLHWIQGAATGAADQIAQNQAGNRQAAEDANAGQSGGVDFGTGLANTAQTIGAPAVSTAVQAATQAYADPFWQAVPAPARAAYIVSQTAQAFGNEVGRNTAQALGIPDQEIVNILGHPVTSHDIAGFVGGAVFDPTSYVAGGETDPILATARGAVRDIGGPLLRGAADTIDRGIGAAGTALDANAERVAGADARATEAGSTLAGGTFGPVPGGGSPSPRSSQTVEVLQQRVAQAQSVVDRLIDAGDPGRLAAAQENRAAIESQLVDAQNARRALEPQIRSEVGVPERAVSPSEQTVENRVDAVNDGPSGPINPQDLSGPVSIPTDTGSRLNAGVGVLPAGVRGPGALNAVTREAGRVVAGGVGGATIGSGLPADTPEERRRNTLIGAGVGMVAGPALSRLTTRGAGGALASLGAIPERDSAEVARLTGALPEGARPSLRFGPAPTEDAPNRAIAIGADPSKRYEMRYQVADLHDLVPSNLPNGAPNPKFPRELQPRARDRVASQLQIDQIARGIEPDVLLTDVGRLDSGPMIVGPDRVVESGNGRVLALQRAATEYPERYQAYVDALRQSIGEYGLSARDLQGIKDPVLVRERVSDVDRAAFAQEANNAGLLRMSNVEQAAADAGNLADDAVTRLQVGENDTIASALRKTENRDVVRQWVGTLPENERAGVLDAGGQMSAQGYERLTNALLMRTYGEGAGERLARAFIESADPTVRNVQTALMASLPDMARAEALIRSGQRDAGLSIAGDVATATEMLARLRRDGVKVGDYLGQGAMWERELTPLQENILEFLSSNQRRPSVIRETLKEYASRVENAADPNQVDMFGGRIASPTREDLWRGATAGAPGPELTPLEAASAATGRAPADGAGLAQPAPEPVARGIDAPPAPDRSQPEVAPAVTPRLGPIPEGTFPAGGPPGRLESPNGPQSVGARPGPVGDIPPTGGPAGTLAVEGAPRPWERPGPVPADVAPTGGPAGRLESPNGPQSVGAQPTPIAQHAAAMQTTIPGPLSATSLPPAAQNWYQRQAARNAAQMAARGVQPLSPLQWLRTLASTVGYASMIGPGTFSVSLASNGLEPLYAIPKEAARGAARAAQTGNMAALREPGAMAAGALTGLGHVGQALWDVIRERGQYAPLPDMAPLSQRTVNPAGRLLASALEVPGRIWSGVPDAIFGTIAEHAGRAREAAQTATNEGLHGSAWSQRVNELLTDAQQVATGQLPQHAATDQIVKAGEAYGDRMSYRDRLGTVGKNVKTATRMGNIPVVSNLIAPFFNTPWNMLLRQAERSPVGELMNSQKGFDKHYDAIVGSALLIGMGSAAKAGLVTGSGPSDPGQRKLLEADGWKPYSTLVGSTYVPNRMFGIAETLLNGAGDAHDFAVYRKPTDDARSLTTDALARIGQLVSQQPFAAGYTSIADLVNYGPVSYGADVATRMTPFASTARMVGTAGDTMERQPDTGKDVTMGQELAGRYAAGVGARATLPVAQDALGHAKPNLQVGAWSVLPRFSPQVASPVADAFRAANMNISAAPSDINGAALSPDQQRRYQALMGQHLEQLLTPMVTAPSWQSMPLQTRRSLLTSMHDAAGKMAGAQLQGEGGADFARRSTQATVRKAQGLPALPYLQQVAP